MDEITRSAMLAKQAADKHARDIENAAIAAKQRENAAKSLYGLAPIGNASGRKRSARTTSGYSTTQSQADGRMGV